MCTSGIDPRPCQSALRDPGGEKGSVLVGVLALLVMLSAFLLVAAHGVVADTDASTRARARTQAFYVAEAGLEYGLAEANADSSWSGLPAPGKDTQEGNFTVAVSRYDESGAALPANQKRLVSTGTFGGATAVTALVVQFQ